MEICCLEEGRIVDNQQMFVGINTTIGENHCTEIHVLFLDRTLCSKFLAFFGCLVDCHAIYLLGSIVVCNIADLTPLYIKFRCYF